MTHGLKLGIEYADAVFFGYKTFEVRYNDRGYRVGDYIKFQVVDGDGAPIGHELNDALWRIMYILEGFEGLADGYVAFAIERCVVG